jgi:hypothetical protein
MGRALTIYDSEAEYIKGFGGKIRGEETTRKA